MYLSITSRKSLHLRHNNLKRDLKHGSEFWVQRKIPSFFYKNIYWQTHLSVVWWTKYFSCEGVASAEPLRSKSTYWSYDLACFKLRDSCITVCCTCSLAYFLFFRLGYGFYGCTRVFFIIWRNEKWTGILCFSLTAYCWESDLLWTHFPFQWQTDLMSQKWAKAKCAVWQVFSVHFRQLCLWPAGYAFIHWFNTLLNLKNSYRG